MWITTEPVSKSILGIFIQRYERRNMLVVSQFIGSLISKYGYHPFTLMEAHGIWRPVMFWGGTKTLFAFQYEKSIIERINQYFKGRTESFDDSYSCTIRRNCDESHLQLDIVFCIDVQ